MRPALHLPRLEIRRLRRLRRYAQRAAGSKLPAIVRQLHTRCGNVVVWCGPTWERRPNLRRCRNGNGSTSPGRHEAPFAARARVQLATGPRRRGRPQSTVHLTRHGWTAAGSGPIASSPIRARTSKSSRALSACKSPPAPRAGDDYYWRINQFVLPFYTLVPPNGKDPYGRRLTSTGMHGCRSTTNTRSA